MALEAPRRYHGTLTLEQARAMTAGQLRHARRLGWLPPLRGGSPEADDANADDDGQDADDDANDAADDDDDGDDAPEGDDDADADDEDDDEHDDNPAAKRARREAQSLRKRLRTTETERDTAQSERDKALGENRRLRAVINAGLDIEDADRLKGETDDELRQDAEALADRFNQPKQRRRPTASDHDSGRQGKRPRDYDPAAETDPEKVAKEFGKNRRRGRGA